MFGLTESEFNFLNEHLIQVLKKHNCKVFIFGSRSNNTNKKFSDIDITYVEDKNKPVDFKVISQIITFFEDSHFSYKVDLVKFDEIATSYLTNVKAQMVEL